jgi:hypothetical protein
MTNASLPATDAIRSLNDDFRSSFVGGIVLLTLVLKPCPPISAEASPRV